MESYHTTQSFRKLQNMSGLSITPDMAFFGKKSAENSLSHRNAPLSCLPPKCSQVWKR